MSPSLVLNYTGIALLLVGIVDLLCQIHGSDRRRERPLLSPRFFGGTNFGLNDYRLSRRTQLLITAAVCCFLAAIAWDSTRNSSARSGRTNVWDSQNRLVHCTYVDGSATDRTRFVYGPDGLRRQQESLDGNGTVLSRKQYVLDGTNAAQCWDTTGQSPVFLASYLYGPRGPECRVDAAGNAIWFMYDGHGNAVGEVTEDGKVNVDAGVTTTLRDYDPWGNMTTLPENLGPPASLLQYCASLGHPSEENTGLIYMRARYYDPLLGRFISEDPAKDGGNWYAYAGNNPVGMVDADGRFFGSVSELFSVAALRGFAVGAGESLALRFMNDVRRGQLSEWQSYAVDMAIGGALGLNPYNPRWFFDATLKSTPGSGAKAAAFFVALHFQLIESMTEYALGEGIEAAFGGF